MPAHFVLNDFITQVKRGGMARPNRYEVDIISPTGGNLGDTLASLYCEITGLPPMDIKTESYRIFGPSFQRAMTPEYGGSGLNMTFYVDKDMVIKKYFDTWMHYIVNPGLFTMNYFNNYARDIRIKQLDEASAVTYQVRIVGAFPKNLSLMHLNHSEHNSTHRLVVTFAYRYWETIASDMQDFYPPISQTNMTGAGVTGITPAYNGLPPTMRAPQAIGTENF